MSFLRRTGTWLLFLEPVGAVGHLRKSKLLSVNGHWLGDTYDTLSECEVWWHHAPPRCLLALRYCCRCGSAFVKSGMHDAPFSGARCLKGDAAVATMSRTREKMKHNIKQEFEEELVVEVEKLIGSLLCYLVSPPKTSLPGPFMPGKTHKVRWECHLAPFVLAKGTYFRTIICSGGL